MVGDEKEETQSETKDPGVASNEAENRDDALNPSKKLDEEIKEEIEEIKDREGTSDDTAA